MLESTPLPSAAAPEPAVTAAQSAYGVRTDNGQDRNHYGCFMSGGDGNLLAAQLVTVLFITGAP